MAPDPCFNVFHKPDLALGEISRRRGKVTASRELVYPLPADSAEKNADLVSADQPNPSRCHACTIGMRPLASQLERT